MSIHQDSLIAAPPQQVFELLTSGILSSAATGMPAEITDRALPVAEAAVDRPDEMVRDVVFRVAGGEQTLRDVVAEFKAFSPQFRKNARVIGFGT